MRSTVTGQDCEKYASCKSCTNLYDVGDMQCDSCFNRSSGVKA